MKLFKVFIAAALLALTTGSAAHAGQKVLASAPALAGATDTLYCDVTNLDPVNPIEVTGEAMDLNGNVVGFPNTITIPPMSGQYFAGFSGPPSAWCRFTVNGSAKNLRAMAVYDDGSSYTVTLPAY